MERGVGHQFGRQRRQGVEQLAAIDHAGVVAARGAAHRPGSQQHTDCAIGHARIRGHTHRPARRAARNRTNSAIHHREIGRIQTGDGLTESQFVDHSRRVQRCGAR